MIHCWSFAYAGGSVRDLAGENDGALNGNVARTVESEFGHTMDFPGAVGDYVDCGDPEDVNFGTGDFALVYWIKPDTLSGTDVFIGKDQNHAIGRQFYTQHSAGTLFITYGKTGNSLVWLQGASGTLKTGIWQQVIAQRRGDSFDIYVNGVLDASGTTGGTHGAMQNTAFSVRLGGRHYPTFTDEMDGQMAEARIYARSFSAAEVGHLWNPATRWSLYADARAIFSIPLLFPATGAQTVTPGIASATAVALQPSVSGTGSATVAPGVAVSTSVALQPTATGTGTAAVTPGVASATAAAHSPTVTAGGLTVIPAIASATAVAYQPTATGTGTATVTPGLSVATSVAYQPAATGTGNTNVSAALASVTANAFSPTAVIGAVVTIIVERTFKVQTAPERTFKVQTAPEKNFKL